MSKWEILSRGILKKNPVLVMMVGLCPVLATSGNVRDGLGMGIATSLVLIFSNLIFSILRKITAHVLRLPITIIIIATLVTIVDYLMQIYQPELSHSLGIFVPLIAVNCLILNRVEIFARKNAVFSSLLDGLGMGIGFTLVITVIASIRELLGRGTFLGNPVFGQGFTQFPIAFLILPPGAFLVISVLSALLNKHLGKSSQ